MRTDTGSSNSDVSANSIRANCEKYVKNMHSRKIESSKVPRSSVFDRLASYNHTDMNLFMLHSFPVLQGIAGKSLESVQIHSCQPVSIPFEKGVFFFDSMFIMGEMVAQTL